VRNGIRGRSALRTAFGIAAALVAVLAATPFWFKLFDVSALTTPQADTHNLDNDAVYFHPPHDLWDQFQRVGR
jgi:hypothetical protein